MSGWIRVAISLIFCWLVSCGGASQQGSSEVTSREAVRSWTSQTLTVSSFNIRFYGSNGTPGSGQESRDPHLKSFLKDNLYDSDVIAFQEIVDVDGLKDLVRDKYHCVSYDMRGSHQHVVLCYDKNYTLAKANSDNNFAIEDLNTNGGLRPGVHGILRNSKGVSLAYVVAVHLKANPEHSATRQAQVELLADSIADANLDIPVIITGDFNTYDDDLANFIDIFAEYDLNMRALDKSDRKTYRSLQHASKFDHILVSDGLRASGQMEIHGPCNNRNLNDGQGIRNIRYYNTNISDHCPISAALGL